MATLYLEIAINAYTMYPDIVTICQQKIKDTGKKPSKPVMGGKIIEITKELLGWKAAKKLRLGIHKLSGKGGL